MVRDLSDADIEKCLAQGDLFLADIKTLAAEIGHDHETIAMTTLQHVVAKALVDISGLGASKERLIEGIDLFSQQLVPMVAHHWVIANLKQAKEADHG